MHLLAIRYDDDEPHIICTLKLVLFIAMDGWGLLSRDSLINILI